MKFWRVSQFCGRVSFATSCWEKDWKEILLRPGYLADLQIGRHLYPFQERILVINNVVDLPTVRAAAEEKVKEGVLTRVVVAGEEILPFFRLERRDFPNDWVYYNAIAPLSALYACESDYLLYLTGDVTLKEPVDWIRSAVRKMEKEPLYAVANLTWNERYDEAKRESFRRSGSFFVAREGFSDQMFLVRTKEFRRPIYGEIRMDAGHYPRGDVFEKRCFSYMKNRGLLRLTYRHGSYTHENF